jgi:hypothetical protein
VTDLEALFGLKLPAQASLIPVDRMIVLWDETPRTHIVTKLRVMNTLDQTDRTDHEYPNSAECCDSRWLTDWQHTPLGLFVQLLADGFPSCADMQAALYQFRNVEGQKGWTSEVPGLRFAPLRMTERAIVTSCSAVAPSSAARRHIVAPRRARHFRG